MYHQQLKTLVSKQNTNIQNLVKIISLSVFVLDSSDYNAREYLFHSYSSKYNLFILLCRVISLLMDKSLIVSSNA